MNISGVKAGDISEVELEDGKAVVTMLVEPQYAELIKSTRPCSSARGRASRT